MEFYNRIMTYVWLIAGVSIFVMTTFMCFTDDFRKWVYYYLFSVISFAMYFMKRWMVKRMEKHLKYLEEQQKQKN
ncbi:MAG: hypothetical protein RIT43_2105 [Bacteroidota bacterium]